MTDTIHRRAEYLDTGIGPIGVTAHETDRALLWGYDSDDGTERRQFTTTLSDAEQFATELLAWIQHVRGEGK